MITRSVVHDWLLAYLNGEIDAVHLAQWARMALDAGRIFPDDEADVRAVLRRLHQAALSAPGLTWDALVDLLERLGYEIQITTALIADEDEHEAFFSQDDAVEPEQFDGAALG